MSGIGDQGMMPDHVRPQRAGDAEQAEVDEVLAGISDDERADAERVARAQAEETRSHRNP